MDVLSFFQRLDAVYKHQQHTKHEIKHTPKTQKKTKSFKKQHKDHDKQAYTHKNNQNDHHNDMMLNKQPHLQKKKLLQTEI